MLHTTCAYSITILAVLILEFLVFSYATSPIAIYSNDLRRIFLKPMISMKMMMHASKQLKGNTLGDINNAHEYNIMKPVFIMGIHAFLLFKRHKGLEYRLYRVSAWRELPDCLTTIADTSLLPLGGPRQSWAAPAARSAGTGQSRTRAALLFGGTRACTGHAKPPGSCHCHLDRLLHPWHSARLRLLI